MKRVLTAALLIPVVIYLALWSPQWLFLAAVLVVAALCFYEYAGLVAAHGIEPPGLAAYGAGFVIVLSPRNDVALVVLAVMLGMTLAMRSANLSATLAGAAAFGLGIVYIFGAWRCAVGLRAFSPYWLLFALALNWIGDIAAYYIGRAMGRHRLAPRVSPAKSWEGAIASVVFSIIFAVVYTQQFLPGVPMWLAAVLALCGNVAGQFGDLAESALKRGAGVKDSGMLLPGHGGWLDRVDSTLFAIPIIYFVLLFALSIP